MERIKFEEFLKDNSDAITNIKEAAAAMHANVNQTYDKNLPYSFHLNSVAETVMRYADQVCNNFEDILPIIFGAYFHDSIEDARQTYRDVMREAQQYMTGDQAFLATEIVYALTNDKGRTRAERAGEKYYAGIRSTLYAPFIKLADRIANAQYSFSHSNDSNSHMRQVYLSEFDHFIASINTHSDDTRLSLPEAMVEELERIIGRR